VAFEQEKQVVRAILSAIEDGPLDLSMTAERARNADPTALYFVFGWVRAWYPATHPAADGVLGRLAELCDAHPDVAQMSKKGGFDPIVDWFEDEYEYRDFSAPDFIELIVEKLEG
jgi:hypothetical protein